MAYWWVSQNKTFDQDRMGGFLWTPQVDRGGACPQHWLNLSLVRRGDTLFSYVGQGICAVVHADTDAKESMFPKARTPVDSHGHDDTSSIGWLVDVTYRVLVHKVAVGSLLPELQPLLPRHHSPLKANGTGALGFVYALPPRAGRLLLENCTAAEGAEFLTSNLSPEVDVLRGVPLGETERQALIQSRLGQGRFRQDVMSYWRGHCAVTGLDLEPLLRASHIKPWRDSNDTERIDPFNGLLLGPSYDAAFDRGLISFDNSGSIIVGRALSRVRCGQLGIDPGARISRLHGNHLLYLAHHRESVFNPREEGVAALAVESQDRFAE